MTDFSLGVAAPPSTLSSSYMHFPLRFSSMFFPSSHNISLLFITHFKSCGAEGAFLSSSLALTWESRCMWATVIGFLLSFCVNKIELCLYQRDVSGRGKFLDTPSVTADLCSVSMHSHRLRLVSHPPVEDSFSFYLFFRVTEYLLYAMS